MNPQERLKARQAAAQVAHDKMLQALLGFTPCSNLTVGDVQYIARLTQTLAFEAQEALI